MSVWEKHCSTHVDARAHRCREKWKGRCPCENWCINSISRPRTCVWHIQTEHPHSYKKSNVLRLERTQIRRLVGLVTRHCQPWKHLQKISVCRGDALQTTTTWGIGGNAKSFTVRRFIAGIKVLGWLPTHRKHSESFGHTREVFVTTNGSLDIATVPNSSVVRMICSYAISWLFILPRLGTMAILIFSFFDMSWVSSL